MSRRNQVPDVDISLLKPPIALGGSGVYQILKTMKVGTEEMKELLLHQCDIVFECKVCKNLFRGLPNFIAHKRVYCKDMHCDTSLPYLDIKNEEEAIVVHPEEAPITKKKTEWDDYIDSEEEGRKEQVESNKTDLEQNGSLDECEGKTSEYKFYQKITEKQKKNLQTRKTSTITLKSVTGNDNAVYQTIQKEGQDDSAATVLTRELRGRGRPKKKRKFEVDDDNRSDTSQQSNTNKNYIKQDGEDVLMVEPQPATGHIRMNLRQRSAPSILDKLNDLPNCDVENLECLKCKTVYSSAKSLLFHMTSLHSEKRTFYPCIYCSAVFAQIWSVTRHITKAHNKSRQEVRGMVEKVREGSFDKSIQEIGEYIHPKVPPPGIIPSIKGDKKDARSSKGDLKKDDANGIDLGSNFIMYRCQECSKIFGKKDSLDRHVRMCPASRKATGSSKVSSLSADQCISTNDKKNSNDDTEKAVVNKMKLSTTLTSDLGVSLEELEKIMAIVDETTLTCLKCYRMFGTISNLHRHAIRHLGWRRFKCKFCKFMCYNRSECRRHLRVVHHKAVGKMSQLEKFIDKLEPEKMKNQRVALPRVELQAQTSKLASRESGKKPPTPSDRNVDPLLTKCTRGGTYNSVGAKSETVLVTRSGMYRKPTFEELTKGTKRERSDSDEDDDESVSDSNKDILVEEKSISCASKKKDIGSTAPDLDMDSINEDSEQMRCEPDNINCSKRKGFTPCKVSQSVSQSPCSELTADTPATALPASRILASRTPTKRTGPPIVCSKSPMANILSKATTPTKLSIPSGVRLPAGTKFVQIPGRQNITLIRAQQPQMTNTGMQQITLLHNSSQVPSMKPSMPIHTQNASGPLQFISATSIPPSSHTYTITGTNAQGMPILKPMQPLTVPSGITSNPPLLKPTPITIRTTVLPPLDSESKQSPPMPTLAPIPASTDPLCPNSATKHSDAPNVSNLKGLCSNPKQTIVGRASVKMVRSLTPQPVSHPTVVVKPRSQTPGPLSTSLEFKQDDNMFKVSTLPKTQITSKVNSSTDVTETFIGKKISRQISSTSASSSVSIKEEISCVDETGRDIVIIPEDSRVTQLQTPAEIDMESSSNCQSNRLDTDLNRDLFQKVAEDHGTTLPVTLNIEISQDEGNSQLGGGFPSGSVDTSSTIQDESNDILIKGEDLELVGQDDIVNSPASQFVIGEHSDTSEHVTQETESAVNIPNGAELLQMIGTDDPDVSETDPMTFIN